MPAFAFQPWLWPIDGEVRESLAWVTDVLTAQSGAEQRIRLIDTPRRIVEQVHTLTAEQRPRAENALWANVAGVWGLPLWMDATRLGAALDAGETVVPADARHRDYQSGGSLVLMTDPDTFEVCDIQAVTDAEITLAAPTASAWPATATVAPLLFGRVPSPLRLGSFEGGAASGTYAFELVNASPWPVADETTGGYRGRPVLTARTDWQADVARDFARPYAEVGNGLVPPARDVYAGPTASQLHGWTLIGRPAIAAFRSFIAARYGRQRGVWLPSQLRDVTLQAPADAADTVLDVIRIDYGSTVAGDVGRRDLQILLGDGARIWRRVTGSTVIAPDVERLQLDAAVGIDVAPDDVVAISWLTPARLEADAVELRWWQWDTVNAQLMFRGTRDDV